MEQIIQLAISLLRKTGEQMDFKLFSCLVFFFVLFGCLQQPYTSQTNQSNISNVPVQNQSTTALPICPSNITNETTAPHVEPPAAPPENETPSPSQTSSIPSTNKSISELMSIELDKLNPPDGAYSIVSYEWVSNQYESDPQAIVINPTMNVLFDNKTEKNLVGFGFKVYKPLNGSVWFANGFAITINESSVLENKFGSFEINYDVPNMARKLHECTINSKQSMLDNRSQLIVIYGFDAVSAE